MKSISFACIEFAGKYNSARMGERQSTIPNGSLIGIDIAAFTQHHYADSPRERICVTTFLSEVERTIGAQNDLTDLNIPYSGEGKSVYDLIELLRAPKAEPTIATSNGRVETFVASRIPQAWLNIVVQMERKQDENPHQEVSLRLVGKKFTPQEKGSALPK